MNPTKRLTGPCSACGAKIQYPAHLVGTVTKCPYCGQSTELVLDTPAQEPTIPKRVVVFTALALLILIFGLAASFIALKWAQTHSSRRPGISTNAPQ